MKLATSIAYFYSLIDEKGIVQFSRGFQKDYEYGYAIEDQARALIVALYLQDNKLQNSLINIFLKAYSKKGVKMMWNEKGSFLPKEDNFEDASAEVVWALGEYAHQKVLLPVFANLYKHLVTGILKTNYTRVISYALLGAVKLRDHVRSRILAEKLVSYFKRFSRPNWEWFEDKLIYANALLPWSLFLSYRLLKDVKYLNTAIISLDFLLEQTKSGRVPIAIGNKGWWEKGKDKSVYDQQPIDISYMVLCLIDAYKITNNKKYLQEAFVYFSWFKGNNLSNKKMIRSDGGCFDGLNESGVNTNSGAESHICYLLASLAVNSVRIPGG